MDQPGIQKNRQILSSQTKKIIINVTALNRFSVGRDHRIIRVQNIHTERRKMVEKMKNKKWQLPNSVETFQNDIDKHISQQRTTMIGEVDIDELKDNIVNAIEQAKETNCAETYQKDKKTKRHI